MFKAVLVRSAANVECSVLRRRVLGRKRCYPTSPERKVTSNLKTASVSSVEAAYLSGKHAFISQVFLSYLNVNTRLANKKDTRCAVSHEV
jgi:hypothetical protein